MKLLRFHLRYYPPGMILEYSQNDIIKTKAIDILHLTTTTNIDNLVLNLSKTERLLSSNIHGLVKKCLKILQTKLKEDELSRKKYYIYKTLQGHILPLTNVAFDKQGKRCLTGSYDRTCKIWNFDEGHELKSLEGHLNVVYSVAFNFPNCDRVITGSFDKTSKIWNVETGQCLATLWGHTREVVCAQFSPENDYIATASMDHTARIYDVNTGQELQAFIGHTSEIVALSMNTKQPNEMITGSFDSSIIIWDTRSNHRIGILQDHEGEISNCVYNWDCNLVASSSLDKTAKVWDIRMRDCIFTLNSHTDEILDIAFDLCGNRLATASQDCTSRIVDCKADFKELALIEGHNDEISKVCFSPGGTCLLTASTDGTARIWNTETGNCSQVLEGHSAEVFSCAFSYMGDAIITASKDNTCRVWR